MTSVFREVCPTSQLIQWKILPNSAMPHLVACLQLGMMCVISVGPNFQLSRHLDALYVAWEVSKDLMHLQDQLLHHLDEIKVSMFLLHEVRCLIMCEHLRRKVADYIRYIYIHVGCLFDFVVFECNFLFPFLLPSCIVCKSRNAYCLYFYLHNPIVSHFCINILHAPFCMDFWMKPRL